MFLLIWSIRPYRMGLLAFYSTRLDTYPCLQDLKKAGIGEMSKAKGSPVYPPSRKPSSKFLSTCYYYVEHTLLNKILFSPQYKCLKNPVLLILCIRCILPPTIFAPTPTLYIPALYNIVNKGTFPHFFLSPQVRNENQVQTTSRPIELCAECE